MCEGGEGGEGGEAHRCRILCPMCTLGMGVRGDVGTLVDCRPPEEGGGTKRKPVGPYTVILHPHIYTKAPCRHMLINAPLL